MDLSESSEKIKTVFRNYKETLSKESDKKSSNEPIISDIKRDCSLFFTAVPEEDTDISPNKNEDATIIRLQKPSRPKFLNLKSKISDIKEITPLDTMTPYTPFAANPGSVISTPMTELNKVLHINTYSICTDPEPEINISKSAKKNYFKNTKILKRSKSLVISSYKKPNGLKPIRRFKTICDPTFITDGIENGFLHNLESIKDELLALKNTETVEELQVPKNPVSEVDQTEKISRRKSLTLPLKSLSFDSANCHNNSDSSGLLTPLMHKLSSLTFEKKSSGISSFNPTPLECKDVIPLFKKEYTEKLIDSSKQFHEDELVECVLFICGQQDTVLGIILEPEVCQNENLINMLWEVCTGKLGGLEKQLQQCMEPYSGNLIPEQEPYSFLCLDSQWDTLKRGGPWETGEASSLSKLHRDFQDHKNITEILSRENDSILYGVHIGDSEIFYRQSESANSGLPTPSDSMGHVPMRAKRSLERDHSIVLL
ncbi:hypothetical protein WA026_020490 [Henosepilachna vigintioctopunctata]|uniref:CCZ1/INTU/HPS4 third Longin domain-containing protein n=1 Tax=Henosepilachna vigintioctopunctata TaxID=420089 RepID=A0AAW1VEX2_9CUCU